MARLRSIKPEFWTSEQIVECSPNARLVFIGIWTFSDDNGIHPASAARLKMEVFPSDSFTREEIAAMVAELIRVGLLVEYTVHDETYWRVTGWHRHQKIDQPTYKFPLQDGSLPPNVRRTRLADDSPNSQRTLDEHSPPERSGRERSGRERNREDEEKNANAPAAPAGKRYDFKSDLFARWKELPDGGGGVFLNKLFRDHHPEQRVLEAVELTLDDTRADPKAYVLGVLAKPNGHGGGGMDFSTYLRDDVP